MAIQFVQERFSKTGRGVNQVPQLDNDGKPIIVDGKPVMGNEQFLADQIVSDSVKEMDLSEFTLAALEVCKGDEATFKADWIAGANHRLRLAAGGSSPSEKAARALVKTLGCSYDEAIALVEKLKR
jgi:hypothetical protein